MDIHSYAAEKQLSLKQVMDFTTCANPLGPSTKAKNALRKHIKDIDVVPDRQARYLTGLIAKIETIDAGNLALGEGSMTLLCAALRAVQARTALLPAPVSRKYEEIILGSNIVLKQIPPDIDNPFSVSLENIIREMKGVDTILMPYPHDRLGYALSESDLSTLIKEARRHGKALIIDEAYRDFTALRSPVKEIIESQDAVILRTFADFHALAGLPMGYAIGPAGTINSIQNCLFPGEVNTLAAHAAVNSLKDKLYKSRTVSFIDEEKEFFRKSFTSIEDLHYLDTLCPFFLLRIDLEPKRLEEVFYRYSIVIDNLIDIDGSHYLRVPVRKHKWNARFLKTLKNALRVTKP